jgi:hypothetical protein
MSITLFGTCRLNKIKNHNNLNNLATYTHSTKEVIQLIKFLKGILVIPKPYNMLCFRSAICENKYINYNDKLNKLFLNTDIYIIEICTRKKYIHNGYYMHHLPFDKQWHQLDNHKHKCYIDRTPKNILNNFKIENQTDEEIENDILEIQKMLYPKKIIIVSHYNSKINTQYIGSRNDLINLLDTICKKHDISFINPTNILSKFNQSEVMKKDLAHYTPLGIQEFSNYMNNYILQYNQNK